MTIEELESRIVAWRRAIHAEPELSFCEHKTSELVAEMLRSLPGLEVATNIAGTGIVATLGALGTRTIAIRADMDALPIEEKTGLSYASRVPGVMHACGHDAHTAMLLGAAAILADEFRDGLRGGAIRFIFQPAEEDSGDDGLTGAPRMVAEGALEGVDAVIALHVSPAIPVRSAQIRAGYFTASVDKFEIRIRASGGHGAQPQKATDPVWMLSAVLPLLYGMISRRIAPQEPAVASIGQIQAGNASNVIPDEVIIRGTLRSFDPAVREQLRVEIERCAEVARTLGGEVDVKFVTGEPSVKNDDRVVAWLSQSARDVMGQDSVSAGTFGMIGEDFSYMTQVVPGAMLLLGAGDGTPRQWHTATFDVDEACLALGTRILAETARRYLRLQYTL